MKENLNPHLHISGVSSQMILLHARETCSVPTIYVDAQVMHTQASCHSDADRNIIIINTIPSAIGRLHTESINLNLHFVLRSAFKFKV